MPRTTAGALAALTRRPAIAEGYSEYAPPPDLAAHVECFWTRLDTSSAPARHLAPRRVLPDGCVDIVVRFAVVESGRTDGPTTEIEATAVGAMTRPLIIVNQGPTFFAGVRFRPGCAYAALRVPAAELTDERVPYAQLDRDSAPALGRVPFEATNEARLEAVVGLVRRRLAGALPAPASVREALRQLYLANGDLRVSCLAAEIGVTRQHLARQFATHVGVTPKAFARVVRARTALARANAARAAYPRSVDWSAIAHDLGYYDQPHFIDDFKAITGLTPARWPG